MRKIRKVLTNVLLSACGMAFAVPGHAGYKLSGEVKNPTPALLEASEIGVRVFNNKAMQDLPDKDALVVMSFGTTMKETRDKTINATVAEIQKALPDVKVPHYHRPHQGKRRRGHSHTGGSAGAAEGGRLYPYRPGFAGYHSRDGV